MKPLALVLLVGCASALHEPRPIDRLAPGHANGRTPAQLIAAGDAAWAKRDASAAQDLYLDAAAGDARSTEPVLGAMRAIAYRLEHEPGAPKRQLADEAVELGQLCQRRDPAVAACDYRLAIALGEEAREHHAAGKDALNHMVELLRRTIARDPMLDHAGAHRVLALVLVRAPAWPAGPGDPDAGLDEAKAAAQLFPDDADNQLALAEALAHTDARDAAHVAYARALALAKASADPAAADAVKQATAGLQNTAP
jgi:hypothetical protein